MSFQTYCSLYLTVLKEPKNVKPKALKDTEIPVKTLKNNANFFSELICLQFNNVICVLKLPRSFNFPNTIPSFANRSSNQKGNYRPISTLPIIAKIFDKLICRQLSNHFDNILYKFDCVVSGKALAFSIILY